MVKIYPKNLLPLSLLFLLSFLFFTCSERDQVDPVKQEPVLTALPDKTQVQPFEILTLTIKNKTLSKAVYSSMLGNKEVMLTKLKDTLLVAMVPEIGPGDYKLSGSIDGSLLQVTYQVRAASPISKPQEYLQEFARHTDYDKFQASLDALVAKGLISRQQANHDLETLKQKEQALLQQIASASPEQQKAAAAIISANRALLDEVNTSLSRLRMASSQQANARTQFIEAGVKARIQEITVAAAKIGVMIGGPALLLSEWGPAGTAAGAALGVAIFKNRLAAQKEIIEASTLALFDEQVVPVMESLKADVRRTTATETFINEEARKTDVSLKLRNIQAADASSKIDFIRQFVTGYATFRSLWNQFMPGFGALPDFPALKEKAATIDFSQVKVEVTENQAKVKGGLVKEGDDYKLKFTTDEASDQEFAYRVTYTLPELDPIKLDKKATLKAVAYTAAVYKGNNQVAGTEKFLSDSLVVRVLDAAGKPVAGFATSWSVLSGGGVISGAGVTDAAGFSRAQWKLGKEEMENKAEVSVKDKNGKEIRNGKVSFLATAKKTYELKYVLGNNQRGTYGSTLPGELIVRVVDHNLMPVKGQQVNWRVAQGGGTITASSVTDENGESKASWKLGASGVQQVEAHCLDKEGKVVPGSPMVFSAVATEPLTKSALVGKWQVEKLIWHNYDQNKAALSEEHDDDYYYLELTEDNRAIFHDRFGTDNGRYVLDISKMLLTITDVAEDDRLHTYKLVDYTPAGFKMVTELIPEVGTDHFTGKQYHYYTETIILKK